MSSPLVICTFPMGNLPLSLSLESEPAWFILYSSILSSFLRQRKDPLHGQSEVGHYLESLYVMSPWTEVARFRFVPVEL
jgi:hypothetical protein